MSLQQVLSIVYRVLIVGAIVAFSYYFRGNIISSLLPFIAAIILAGMMEPAVNNLDRYLRVGRTAATTAVFLLVLVVGGYALTLMTAKVVAEIVDMSDRATTYQAQINETATDLLNRLTAATEAELIPSVVQDALEERVGDLAIEGGKFISSAVQKIEAAAVSIPTFILIVTVTLLATFFVTKDRALIYQSLILITPVAWRAKVSSAQERIVQDIIVFAKGQLLILLLTTSVAAFGMYLLGIRYWMTLGLIAGILDFIPVVGPGFLFVPWIAVSWALGDTSLAIALAVIFVAVFAVRQIFQTKILGDSIGVHPLLMLASIYGGIVWFGVYGLIIGPILIIIGRALINAEIIPWPRPVATDADEMSSRTPSEGRAAPHATDFPIQERD